MGEFCYSIDHFRGYINFHLIVDGWLTEVGRSDCGQLVCVSRDEVPFHCGSKNILKLV